MINWKLQKSFCTFNNIYYINLLSLPTSKNWLLFRSLACVKNLINILLLPYQQYENNNNFLINYFSSHNTMMLLNYIKQIIR